MYAFLYTLVDNVIHSNGSAVNPSIEKRVALENTQSFPHIVLSVYAIGRIQ